MGSHENFSKQLERAASFWKTGIFMEPKNDRHGKGKVKSSFSGDNYAGRVQIYVKLVEKLTPKQWDKLVDATEEAHSEIMAKASETDSEIDVGEDGWQRLDAFQAADMVAMDEDSD